MLLLVFWTTLFSSKYHLVAMHRNHTSKLRLAALVSVTALTAGRTLHAVEAPGQATRQSQVAVHQRQAQQDLQQHHPDQAIEEYRAILKLDAKNLDAHGNLGVLLFFQGAYHDAIPQLRAALSLKPDLWRLQSLLGLAERRTGDDTAGRADLEAAFPHMEDATIKTDVGRELIDSYSSTGELDKAASIASALLKINPTDPALLYTAYRLYSDLAGEAMLDLSLTAPASGQMHQAMAHELQRARDERGALKNYREALAIDLNLPGLHFELAEALHSSADPALHAEAEQQYQLAIAANPRDVRSIRRMGEIAEEKSDPKAAEALYRRALQIQPTDADSNLGLAHILVDRGQLEEALPILEAVVASDPTNVLAHYRLSALYRRMQRPDDAKREIAAYEKYKDMKEKLRKIYAEMRLDDSQAAGKDQ